MKFNTIEELLHYTEAIKGKTFKEIDSKHLLENTTNLKDYLSNKFAGDEEIVAISDLEEYQVMLNLRTSEGLDLNKFNKIFNKDLYACKKNIIDSYIASNHLILKENTLIPTFEGMMILDKICLDLFE